MFNAISLPQWQRNKVQQAAPLPDRECPQCGVRKSPLSVSADNATVYRCVGPGHRSFVWRIAGNGDMLQGLTGNIEYAVC